MGGGGELKRCVCVCVYFSLKVFDDLVFRLETFYGLQFGVHIWGGGGGGTKK